MKFLFNITHGFQARMLLRSRIRDELLAAGAELVILSPNARDEYFRQEFEHPQITLETLPTQVGRIEANLANLRQYLLMNPELGATLNAKNEAFRRQTPVRYYCCRAANQLLGRISILRRGYIAAESKLFPGHEFDEILTRHHPDLVVTGTPGFNLKDIHLLRAARRFQIPSATVMLSWDNLSSKGYMGAKPDDLLVWSDLMRDEAVRYHQFPQNRIQWCGAAQFDHYFEYKQRFDQAAWRRTNGIPESAALLVYGTINPALVPHEQRLVEELADAVRRDVFVKPTYLWVRLHPQVVQGFWSHDLGGYRALAGERIRIEEPPVRDSSLSWDLPKEDADHLAALMAAADVVLTPNSTLSIDAACVDTPIINYLYDGRDADEGGLSIRRFRYYTHYAKILETGGITLVENEGELHRAIDSYLLDRSLHREGRFAILTQQFNRLDGKAGARTAELLLEHALSTSARNRDTADSRG
ncbi:MAG: hypothetical protein QM811_28000 [Pirellulales bacterium]